MALPAAATLRGLLAVVPTAFHDDGSLDPAGVERLVVAYLDGGAAGLTVLGVMGEASELDEDERRTVLRVAVGIASGSPIVVGVTADHPGAVAERARGAVTAGATALMVSPTRSVPLDVAVAAAASAGAPIVIQDHPQSSGVSVTAEAVAAVIAEQPLVAAVKVESPPTPGTIAALRGLAPHVAVMGGLGALFLVDELRAGSSGAMTGAAVPDRIVDVIRRFPEDPDGAEAAWTAMLPLLRLEAFSPFSLVARKEVWRRRGVIASARCRLPGARLDDGGRAMIERALAAVDRSDARGLAVSGV